MPLHWGNALFLVKVSILTVSVVVEYETKCSPICFRVESDDPLSFRLKPENGRVAIKKPRLTIKQNLAGQEDQLK